MRITPELRALLEACPIPQIKCLVAVKVILIHRSRSNECNQLRSQGSKDDFSRKGQQVTAQIELKKPYEVSKQ